MLKNILSVKSTVLLNKRIQEFVSCYHRVMRKLHYHLQQDSFKTANRTTICAKCAKDKLFIVVSLRCCVYQQPCDLYHQ